MRKVWIVAWHDLRMTLHNRRTWLIWVLVPAAVIYLVGLGAQGLASRALTTIRVDVLDQDHSTASTSFMATLGEANPTLLICPADNDPADECALSAGALSPELAQERLASDVTSATLIVPEGFGAALEAGRSVTLVLRSKTTLITPEFAFQAVQNAVTRMSGKTIAARLSTEMAEVLGLETGLAFYRQRLADAEAALGPPSPIHIRTEFTQPNKTLLVAPQLLQNGFAVSTPSTIVVFVMISIMGLTQSLAEERMNGVLRRVGMMPVRKAELLGGKLLQTWLVGLAQFLLLLGFGETLGVDFRNDPFAVILVASAYVLAITALALALATIARTPKQASGIATFAWMVLGPLGGAWWPLTFVPHWMQTLGHLSPVAWCLDALNALSFHQGTLRDVLGSVGVLLLFSLVLFGFGVKNLSYQQPNLLLKVGPSSVFRRLREKMRDSIDIQQ